jgi:uncharacterized protein YggE
MEDYATNSSNVTKNKPRIITLLSLITIALFTVLSFFKFGSTVSTISVTGKADVSAKADYVKFVVTKVNTGTNVSTTVDDGTNGINKLINIIQELAGPDLEIKKTFYQVSGDSTSGYSIANAFSIKTANVDNIDNLIKQLYLNGATTVSNVTFESADINNVEEELRQNVYTNAKDKAKRIAASAGKHLGKVVSITDDDASITTTIEDLTTSGGLINISKSASVIYKIW